jgi:hypothetical protein
MGAKLRSFLGWCRVAVAQRALAAGELSRTQREEEAARITACAWRCLAAHVACARLGGVGDWDDVPMLQHPALCVGIFWRWWRCLVI